MQPVNEDIPDHEPEPITEDAVFPIEEIPRLCEPGLIVNMDVLGNMIFLKLVDTLTR